MRINPLPAATAPSAPATATTVAGATGLQAGQPGQQLTRALEPGAHQDRIELPCRRHAVARRAVRGQAPRLAGVHDFNNGVRDAFNQAAIAEAGAIPFPAISLDLWFEVDDESLHRVYELLPDLDWSGSKVGIRISYEARDPLLLHANYRKSAAEAAEGLAESQQAGNDGLREADAAAGPEPNRYQPWPRDVLDYLDRRLGAEYELRYYKLNESQFDSSGVPVSPEYAPARMDGSRVLNSLFKVDFVRAQRDLTDPDGPARSDNLSKRLSSFYQHNLQPVRDRSSGAPGLC